MFSEKVLLDDKIIAWAEENNIRVCPASTVTFLQKNGLLDEDAIHKFMGREDLIKKWR